jgi:hypothetical protein
MLAERDARSYDGGGMETDVGALSASKLAELAGATKAQVERLVGLGVLVARDGAGRLSFAFLEAAPFRRWAVRSARTYRAVSQETGVPLDPTSGTLWGRCWRR